MKKLTSLTLSILFLTMGLAFAQQSTSGSQSSVQPVEVGNKICPVSKEPVTGAMSDKPVTIEYKGKIYNLCCPGCLKAFKNNPEKYSKIAEDEVAAKK